MAQLGILFDMQKLSDGFFGYTAFRILFSILKPGDLAGSSLSHGEVGQGKARAYCIAVDCDSDRAFGAVKQKMAASLAGALMPREFRFVTGPALHAETLVFAARVTDTGELAQCHSRWMYEAWQRALQADPTARPAMAVAIKPQSYLEPVHSQLPSRVPFACWWSHHARRTFAVLVAFCFGAALMPWLGYGVAFCIMVSIAGVVQGLAIQWRLWEENGLSGEPLLDEMRRIAGMKTLPDLCQRLEKAPAQASPLLRSIHSVTTAWLSARDHAVAAAVLDQQRAAERQLLQADLEELRYLAWGVPALAACSFYAMQVFVGIEESWMEAPRLALAGLAGGFLLQGLRTAVAATAERLSGEVSRLVVKGWLPVLQSGANTELDLLKPKAMSATA